MASNVIPFAAPHVKRHIVVANDNDDLPPAPAFALSARKIIEDEIERLIALLDASDGDCDLEDTFDRECFEHYPLPPRYGVNQLRMVNEHQIIRHYQTATAADYRLPARRAA